MEERASRFPAEAALLGADRKDGRTFTDELRVQRPCTTCLLAGEQGACFRLITLEPDGTAATRTRLFLVASVPAG